MVTIITGPINSGKTTKIKDTFQNSKAGDGFISVKLMKSSTVNGFDIMRLSTGQSKPFIRRSGSEPKGWIENCTQGPYTVSDEAVKWVNEEINELLENRIGPVYLDEIGIIEISGKCFSGILKKMIDSDRDIYITVRDQNLDMVLETFNIVESNIITTGERYA